MIGIYIFALLWSVRIVLNLLSYIHLWYIKEYRFDRMMIHLKTKQGKRFLFLPFRRPPIKPKTLLLFLCSVVTLLGIYFTLEIFILWKFAIIDLILFPVTAFFVMITKLPTYFYHRWVIQRAIQKLNAHKPMMIIGITGSFGKTSTKEFLATILSQKFKTLKTEGSKNSPIGIAELILSGLQPDHEVFIVEMGAYKRGEISAMCAMVHPQIGIVTAINEQHQDLFGTIQETISAKYELIQGLHGKKIAIFNADNTYTKAMSDRAKNEGNIVALYSAGKIQSSVRPEQESMSFELEGKHITVHLIGTHQVSNILAAITAAKYAGMTMPEIVRACVQIQPIVHTMRPLAGIRGSTYIDDTFNNNPDAARAAIDYLKGTKGKKILVFQPMIELGSSAGRHHEEIAKYAATVCDEVILTNDSYKEFFVSGVVMDAKSAASHIREIVQKGDTVLFKGKEAARVLNNL